ncbi:hypothetical protein FHX42_002840 [Saccharopolyspora lacisalsi]|uniref:Uncharacterized protein n=1 Tax=Halosaccharopolyspora lacisalsi TaxID=1000566 RepID=A0A839DXN0_9PSEU|nr:hypothetical protein [Halosaccharopolyspora lacisalsi]MBA8825489.1 hypothetical protein [Halosaccharopolyspora lacisalsi]
MQDFDQWRRLGKHWHAYSEKRDEQGQSTRVSRLAREPDVTLFSPRSVAEWLADRTREHSPRTAVKLLGENAGWGHMADGRHIDHDLAADESTASRGDSIYVSITRQDERTDLWVEAVMDEECPEVHHEQE